MPRFILFFVLLLLIGCKSSQDFSYSKLSDTSRILFLDSVQASQTILIDNAEDFFKKISKVDMAIQMKEPIGKTELREDVVNKYKEYLIKDVSSFSPDEKEFVENIFLKIYKTTAQLSADLFPKEVQLIKTHGKHYGPSVYYTRENCIVIPANVLKDKNEKSFLETMHHEIFHIYSRLNPNHRNKLYKLIGFESLKGTDLQMDIPLSERLLLNPDGIDYAYAISLSLTDGTKIRAIPLIVSNEDNFEKSKPQFFNYLQFDLYEIKEEGDKTKVISKSDGSSTLELDELKDFYRQIKDNTGYIIHPDEIMADNYMFLMKTIDDVDFLDRFSQKGQELILNIKAILAE